MTEDEQTYLGLQLTVIFLEITIIATWFVVHHPEWLI